MKILESMENNPLITKSMKFKLKITAIFINFIQCIKVAQKFLNNTIAMRKSKGFLVMMNKRLTRRISAEAIIIND